jgi:hypothetical protein
LIAYSWRKTEADRDSERASERARAREREREREREVHLIHKAS